MLQWEPSEDGFNRMFPVTITIYFMINCLTGRSQKYFQRETRGFHSGEGLDVDLLGFDTGGKDGGSTFRRR
jgi:hypothetical protein